MVAVSRRRVAACPSYWLLVGNKKYLLLTDNNCALHASQSVMFSSQVGSLYIGSWFGSFPVPPKGVKDVYLIND